MIQSGTNLADFLPRRLAWGIVIVVLLGIAIFALPNMKFGSGNVELNLADRNTYMQLLGMTKAEITQKFGQPKSESNDAWTYDLPQTMPAAVGIEMLRIEFNATDRCQRFEVIKQNQKLEVIERLG